MVSSAACSPLTARLPPVIPVWGAGGDAQDTDPGATPDQHLFAVIEDSSYVTNAQLGVNCPGVSSTFNLPAVQIRRFSLRFV